MESDELKDVLQMNFPNYKIDNDKIISLCKNQRIILNMSSIIKPILILVGIVLIIFSSLTISNININDSIPNVNKPDFVGTVNKTEGFETTFSGYDGKSQKPTLGYDIGYRTDSSVFNIENVKIELMIGHFFGPSSKLINEGQIDDSYSFDYDSWKDGPYYSSARASQYGTAKIFIRTEIYPTTIEEEVYSIDNFYDNYLFIYTMAMYSEGKYGWFQYEDICPRNTIKDFVIDKKFFSNDEGSISIGIGFGDGGSKYVNLYYCKDVENNLIYLSCESIEDAENKYIKNSSIETKYIGYEGVFQ